MFEVAGFLSFEGPPPVIPAAALPCERIPTTAGTAAAVEGHALRARYLFRDTTPASYHRDGARHVFVAGEARLRRDAGADASAPLTAAEVAATDPARLKGNFTIVSVDEDRRSAELLNGRYGISPFYYAHTARGLAFSTSLGALVRMLSPSPDLDPAGVAELEVFNYPLGGRTFFRGVSGLRAAERVTADRDGLDRSTWWDVRTLYDAAPYTTEEALEAGSDLFAATVQEMAAGPERLTASFTSGFDSRAIWAVLGPRPGALGYSFGIAGSLNVTVPERMTAELGIAFEPIYLDERYERSFADNAERALLLSDCLSTVERANYPYAFERLGRHSPVVLTGLFGSELLRTFQNVGLMFTAPMAELTRAGSTLDARAVSPGPYVAAGDVADQIAADVEPWTGERFEGMTSDQRFYMFLLTEGLRKYFGAETHMERAWAENRFPFLDDEFVEFAFRAPFSGVHSRPLTPTVGNRFRSQYFYAHVIRRHWPELLRYPTDHGYAPSDLLGPLSLARVGTKFTYQRWRKRRAGYREFKTDEWTERLFAQRLRADAGEPWLSPRFASDLASGAWRQSRSQFVKAASLKMWLEAL